MHHLQTFALPAVFSIFSKKTSLYSFFPLSPVYFCFPLGYVQERFFYFFLSFPIKGSTQLHQLSKNYANSRRKAFPVFLKGTAMLSTYGMMYKQIPKVTLTRSGKNIGVTDRKHSHSPGLLFSLCDPEWLKHEISRNKFQLVRGQPWGHDVILLIF